MSIPEARKVMNKGDNYASGEVPAIGDVVELPHDGEKVVTDLGPAPLANDLRVWFDGGSINAHWCRLVRRRGEPDELTALRTAHAHEVPRLMAERDDLRSRLLAAEGLRTALTAMLKLHDHLGALHVIEYGPGGTLEEERAHAEIKAAVAMTKAALADDAGGTK